MSPKKPMFAILARASWKAHTLIVTQTIPARMVQIISSTV